MSNREPRFVMCRRTGVRINTGCVGPFLFFAVCQDYGTRGTAFIYYKSVMNKQVNKVIRAVVFKLGAGFLWSADRCGQTLLCFCFALSSHVEQLLPIEFNDLQVLIGISE
jgi:hypothetical protein